MLLELDLVVPWMQGITYILLLIVVIAYYIKAYKQPQLRPFWLLVGGAWSMNLFANIVWIIRYAVTEGSLDTITILDLFYIAPYILIGCALWFYPTALPRRTWVWMIMAMALVMGLVFVIYHGHIAIGQNNRGTVVSFLMYSFYPILDAGLVSLAWIRYGATKATPWSKISLLLALAVTSYFAANIVELMGYIFSPIMGGFLQNFLWLTKHLLGLAIAIRVKKPGDVIDV